MDRIKEMLDRIGELDDAALSNIEGEILSEFETVEKQDATHETVAAMTGLADALDSVRGEVARRTNERAALEQAAAEAAARVKGTKPGDSQENPNAPTDALPGDVNPADLPPEPGVGTPPPDVPVPDVAPVTPGVPGGQGDTGDYDPNDPLKKKKPFPAAASDADQATTATETPAPAEASVTTEAPIEAVASTTPENVPDAPASNTPASPAEAAPAPAADAAGPEGVATPAVPGAEPVVVEGETDSTRGGGAARPQAEGGDESPEGDESDDSTATEASTTENTTNTAPQEAAVTAAAPQDTPVIEAPADRRPTPKSVSVAITAGADIPNFTAGSPLADMDQVAKAFSDRLHGLRRVTAGDGEQHIVASLSYEFPEDRHLVSGDDVRNAVKIEGVTGPAALVASGGFCAPLEQRYDFFELSGTTDRPVRDSLPKFQADRGGIRYPTSPVLKGGATDYFAASSVWTEAMDKAPGNWVAGTGNLKPCIVVDCPPQVEAITEAVTVCLQFGNLMTRAYPELIKRHNELAMIAHARESEESLLTKISAGSVAVSTAKTLGAARDFFQALENAAVHMRYRHRMALNAPLRVIAPFWLQNLVRGDLLRQMPGDGPEFTWDLAEAKIAQWFRTRNINVTWGLDGGGANLANAQAAGALKEIPENVDWFIFPEGTWLYLDGGTLDLGIIRDSSLVATNDYKTFVETFEGLAKMGPESLKVTSVLDMCGAAQALIDACGGTTATTD